MDRWSQKLCQVDIRYNIYLNNFKTVSETPEQTASDRNSKLLYYDSLNQQSDTRQDELMTVRGGNRY